MGLPANAVPCVSDPQPQPGAEVQEDGTGAGPDAPGAGGDSTEHSAVQQRVLHAELSEPPALLHLVVELGAGREGRGQ